MSEIKLICALAFLCFGVAMNASDARYKKMTDGFLVNGEEVRRICHPLEDCHDRSSVSPKNVPKNCDGEDCRIVLVGDPEWDELAERHKEELTQGG